MSEPVEKKKYDDTWNAMQPRNEEWGMSPLAWIRRLFFRLFGPRKHPRGDVDFMHPLRVRVTVGNKKHEVVPEDIARGGMGLRCSSIEPDDFPVGTTVPFEVAFDGENFETIQAEIRFSRQSGSSCYLGLKFTNISASLIQAIEKELKRRKNT